MADNDGRIYITITNKPSGGGHTPKPPGEPKPKNPKKSEEEKQWDYVKDRLASFLESQAKQMINYTVNNIGNFTGDYQSQREIQNSVSVLKMLGNIGMSTLAGAKFGVPGAIVGFAVATVSQGINIGLNEYANSVQYKKHNYEISILRQISGLDTLTNGSRI